MMKNISTIKLISFFCVLHIFFVSCQKEFLDIKNNKSRVIPEQLKDFQALLDNTDVMNLRSSHGTTMLSADESYVTSVNWNVHNVASERNAYIWAKEIYEGENSNDWNNAYKRVLYANIALEGLEKILRNAVNAEAWDNVKGTALFVRSLSFYELAQQFAPVYDAANVAGQLGIPLRLASDINAVTKRAGLAETYERLIMDLKEANGLLPDRQPVGQRPTAAAATALLARVFLQMENYGEALHFADLTLAADGYSLLDYNTLEVNARYPFPAQGIDNPEVLYYCVSQNALLQASARFNVDTVLMASYQENDLRSKLYFFNNNNANINFRGSYSGAYAFFTGLALDEIVLIKAECEARLDKLEEAKKTLLMLQQKRYTSGTVERLRESDRSAIIEQILDERRKQLYCRGTRWEDLRRLNKDPKYAKELKRELNGTTYTLLPNDIRYVLPIPQNVITLSGIEQNPR